MAKDKNNNSNSIKNSSAKNVNQVQNNYAKKDTNSNSLFFAQLFQQIYELREEIESLKQELRNKKE